MGKHDVIHASDLNDEQLTFENLRYLYGTGRSYIISGSGKYRKMGYRMGVQTELGDLEESEWQQLMRALIKKAGEQELHLQLLQWVTNHCAGCIVAANKRWRRWCSILCEFSRTQIGEDAKSSPKKH